MARVLAMGFIFNDNPSQLNELLSFTFSMIPPSLGFKSE